MTSRCRFSLYRFNPVGLIILIFLSLFSYSSLNKTIDLRAISCKNDSLISTPIINIDKLNPIVYQEALQGLATYSKTYQLNHKLIAIVDFDLPSTQKRLFIIDIETNKLIHSSLVAHGSGSGFNLAQQFSNINGSHQSSIGFFKTSETYIGKHGLSLRLDGLDKGVNDKARERNIVIHGADYVSEAFIKKNNRLGRSWGCPALPIKDYNKVLDYLDDEIILFIHATGK